jgi:hypothetical protein
MSQTETPYQRFERQAAAFYRETGLLAPGKDVPPELASDDYDDQRTAEWLAWLRANAPAPVSPPSGSAGITRATRVSDRVLDGRLSVRTLNALTNASSLRVEGEAPSLGQVFDMDDVALLRTRCIGTRTVREIRALQREVDAPPALETDETRQTVAGLIECDAPARLRALHGEFYGGPKAHADAFRMLPRIAALLETLDAQPAARREGAEPDAHHVACAALVEVVPVLRAAGREDLVEVVRNAYDLILEQGSALLTLAVLSAPAPEGVEPPAFHAGHAIALHMVIELACAVDPTGDAQADRNVANALRLAREVQRWLEPLVHGGALAAPRSGDGETTPDDAFNLISEAAVGAMHGWTDRQSLAFQARCRAWLIGRVTPLPGGPHGR